MKKIIFITITILFILINYFFNWWFRDKILTYKYTYLTKQQPIMKTAQIDAIFSNFEQLKFKDLPKEYISFTKSDEKKYKKLLINLKFYKINRKYLHHNIVANFKLNQFICRDTYYKECVLNNNDYVICTLKPQIFYKLLELVNEMKKNNLDVSKIFITDGHRHPQNNEKVGGAKLSRHIKGEAIDFNVGDINKDGNRNQKDKKIILDLLENKIIKNDGGIGRYPSTFSLHFDLRGYRARWDSY